MPALVVMLAVLLASGSFSAAWALEIESESLTGDPVLDVSTVSDWFRGVLSRDEFVYVDIKSTGGQQINEARVRIQNALSNERLSSVHISIEQTWYGPLTNSRDLVGLYHMLGLIGVALAREPFGGLVQFRAKAMLAGHDDPIVVVGVGICPGDRIDLDRRTALILASRRGLWDLAWKLNQEVNRRLKLGLRSRTTSMKLDEYRSMIDGPAPHDGSTR